MKPQYLVPALLLAALGINRPVWAAEPHAAHHPAPAVSTAATLTATGVVKSVDATAGKLVIDHDPIPALKWPRMTMDFRLADRAMAAQVKAGDAVKFEIKEGEKGAYVITAIEPAR